MARWRTRLFVATSRITADAAEYVGLPRGHDPQPYRGRLDYSSARTIATALPRLRNFA
jgi:hypothetical protein